MSTPPVVLSIAGTDSGGAAGLAADLATFASLGAHGACVVAAVTAQDTTGVRAIHATPAEMLEAQLDAVLEDLPIAAIKTGMLGSAAAVERIAARLVSANAAQGPRWHSHLVVDPVLRASTGSAFADQAMVQAYRDHLLPIATVITPNAREARVLLDLAEGDETPPRVLAAELSANGPAAVVTGGPEPGERGSTCTDWLAIDGEATPLTHPAVATTNDHGTGCTFSAALAALLARNPRPKSTSEPTSPRGRSDPEALRSAVRQAAAFTTSRLALSRHWDLGRGRGPIGHAHDLRRNIT